MFKFNKVINKIILVLLQDDSGDPLYAEGIQYGLVSYLYKPCTIKEKPGIFTRLANYVDWINAAMID